MAFGVELIEIRQESEILNLNAEAKSTGRADGAARPVSPHGELFTAS